MSMITSSSAVPQRRPLRVRENGARRGHWFRFACVAVLSIGVMESVRRAATSMYQQTHTPTSSVAGFASGRGVVGAVKRVLHLNFKEKGAEKKLKHMLQHGSREADAEFHALTEKTAWADLVEAQLSSELDALSTEGSLHALLADRSSFQAALAAVKNARLELTKAISDTEKKASKRALEVEKITAGLKHTSKSFQDLATKAERPVTEGRLLEVLSLARTQMDGLKRTAEDAQVALESTEKVIETNGARQVFAKEKSEAAFLPMVSAMAAMLLAISAYGLVVLPGTVAAATRQAQAASQVWDECQLGEPDCIEIEVEA